MIYQRTRGRIGGRVMSGLNGQHSGRAGMLSGVAAAIAGMTVNWASSPGNLIPPGFGLTRTGGGATYYDSTGTLQTAAADTARGTYIYNGSAWVFDGTMIEAAATNLALQSETFDNASWTKLNSTITANSTVAPDGNTTADSVVATAASSGVYQTLVKAASAIQYTASWFVRASSKTWVVITLWDGITNGSRYWFQLSGNGAVGSTSSFGTPFTGLSARISVAANSYYRVEFTATSNTAVALVFGIQAADGDGSFSSETSGTQFIVWGAQLETGGSATSYIATGAAAVTRNADVVTATTSGLLVNAQGFAAIGYRTIASGTTAAQLSTWTGSGSMLVTTNATTAFVYNGVNIGQAACTPQVAGEVEKIASTWVAGSYLQIAANGTVGAQAALAGNMNNGATIRIGDHVSAFSEPISMVLQSLRLGVQAVNNSRLANPFA